MIMAICLAAGFIFPTVIILHAQESANQHLASLLPSIHQRLQDEQDPAKLRHEAVAFLDETVSEGNDRERYLRFLVKMAILVGFGFVMFSLSTGIWAYRLQCEERKKLSLSDSDLIC